MNVLILVIGLVTLSETKSVLEVSENDIPDLQYMDTSVDPCDDFYQYTCGNFKNIHQRPEHLQQISIYSFVEDYFLKVGNEILSSPKLPQDPEALKKVKSAYQACIDTNFAFSIDPPELQLIREFGGMPLVSSSGTTKLSWAEIGEIVGKTGIQQMFSFTVLNFNPDDYAVSLFLDSWEDPEMIRPWSTRSYDQVLEESFKTAARKPKERSLTRSSDPFDVFLWKISDNIIRSMNGNSPYYDQAKLLKDLEDIKDFKAKLESGGDLSGDEILPLGYSMTLQQLQNWTDLQFKGEVDMNWVEYVGNIFKWSGKKVDSTFEILYYNVDVDFIYGVLNLVKNTDPSIVKNFVLLRILLLLSPDGSKPNRDAFKEYYTSLGLHVYEDWEYCARKLLDVVDTTSLSLAVVHHFQRYHFDDNKIRNAVKLIGEIRDAFKTIVTDADWVDQESRDAVVEKIDNIVIDLAYPDFVVDEKRLDDFYENVGICEWDHYGNSRRIRALRQAYTLSKLRDKGDFWEYPPFKVNAFSRPASLKIMLLVSMLHDLYFTGNNPVLDYSRLGTTIGHEMTHHFDESGRTYDQKGYANPFWISNATIDNFINKTQCLVNQYDSYYVPEIDKNVQGCRTLNENFADNGGLRKAFLAYQKSIREDNIRNASKKYTLDQLFFIGYGTMWCSDDSPEYLEYLSAHTAYAPQRIRALGSLSNLQEFSDAFNCPVGSNMNPKEKCVAW